MAPRFAYSRRPIEENEDYMPCGYHLNLDEGIVTITASEDVPLADVKCVGRQMLADPQFDADLPHLVDLRGLQIAPSAKDSACFRNFILKEYRPNFSSSVAVVIDHTLDQQSLAGLYHLTCAMAKTELFDQYTQALKWLMRREFA